MKRIFRFAVVGSAGLILGSSVSAGLRHCDEPEREQINPACSPAWGYHQTCWRRFPYLPPCNVCPDCQTGGSSQSSPHSTDGSFQFEPIEQPSPAPVVPQSEPVPQPDPVPHQGSAATSGRYGGHAVMPAPQMTTPNMTPSWQNASPMMMSPGMTPGATTPAPPSQYSGHAYPTQPLALPGGGRYHRTAAPAAPPSLHMTGQARQVPSTPPARQSVPQAITRPAPPLPTDARPTSRYAMPALTAPTTQPVMQPARRASARPGMQSVSHEVARPVIQSMTHSAVRPAVRPATMPQAALSGPDRTPIRPQPVGSQPVAAPLLRLPVTR